MKILGRKGVRTCLSMLLVVTCLLTSFSLYIDSKAQDQVVDSFYILDEEGNPVTIEVTQGDLMSDYEPQGISLFSFGRSRIATYTNTRSNVASVVRFKSDSGLVYYTEVDTGREGYFHCKSAGDAAYLGEQIDDNGKKSIICKLSGVVMKVPEGNIKDIAPFDENQTVSYYQVVDGYLIHTYTYYYGSELRLASTRVGHKPSYLDYNKKYYSYDGHYFYTDFAQMILDCQNNTYNNAVNRDTPHYNYYQYLSFHTTAPFTAEQYNSYVASKNKPGSLMLTTGNAFVAAQYQYTINALLMYSIAINESAWGTSEIALTKNNLFGLNAVDSSPGESANAFSSVEQCINEFAYNWIHKGYLDGGNWKYRGPHLGDKHSGLNVKYASDPYWGEKAASHAYYYDTDKVDYGRYSLGIATSGKIQLYKEPDTSSAKIYTTDASNGTNIYDFPVTILGEDRSATGELFYKVASDMSLMDDRSKRNVEAIYNTERDYVYVRATDVKLVFDGSGNLTPPPTPSEPSTSHQEVLSALGVANSSNYLTGFAVGSDVERIIAKVRALDSSIPVVVKRADGTQITSGTVATGMKITITTNGSTIDYSIVIRGDVNGDGKLSAVDYVKVRNYLDGKSGLSDSYLRGADASGDGKTSALDYVKLRNHLDGKSAIAQ